MQDEILDSDKKFCALLKNQIQEHGGLSYEEELPYIYVVFGGRYVGTHRLTIDEVDAPDNDPYVTRSTGWRYTVDLRDAPFELAYRIQLQTQWRRQINAVLERWTPLVLGCLCFLAKSKPFYANIINKKRVTSEATEIYAALTNTSNECIATSYLVRHYGEKAHNNKENSTVYQIANALCVLSGLAQKTYNEIEKHIKTDPKKLISLCGYSHYTTKVTQDQVVELRKWGLTGRIPEEVHLTRGTVEWDFLYFAKPTTLEQREQLAKSLLKTYSQPSALSEVLDIPVPYDFSIFDLADEITLSEVQSFIQDAKKLGYTFEQNGNYLPNIKRILGKSPYYLFFIRAGVPKSVAIKFIFDSGHIPLTLYKIKRLMSEKGLSFEQAVSFTSIASDRFFDFLMIDGGGVQNEFYPGGIDIPPCHKGWAHINEGKAFLHFLRTGDYFMAQRLFSALWPEEQLF